MIDADLESANTISIVHTNLVAPIIIKNCQEEFQHVSDLQDPVIYGRLSQHSVNEHPLIQVHSPSCVLKKLKSQLKTGRLFVRTRL